MSPSSEPLLGVGAVDFAGSLAVLGPRKGRFYEDAVRRRCANKEEGCDSSFAAATAQY